MIAEGSDSSLEGMHFMPYWLMENERNGKTLTSRAPVHAMVMAFIVSKLVLRLAWRVPVKFVVDKIYTRPMFGIPVDGKLKLGKRRPWRVVGVNVNEA